MVKALVLLLALLGGLLIVRADTAVIFINPRTDVLHSKLGDSCDKNVGSEDLSWLKLLAETYGLKVKYVTPKSGAAEILQQLNEAQSAGGRVLFYACCPGCVTKSDGLATYALFTGSSKKESSVADLPVLQIREWAKGAAAKGVKPTVILDTGWGQPRSTRGTDFIVADTSTKFFAREGVGEPSDDPFSGWGESTLILSAQQGNPAYIWQTNAQTHLAASMFTDLLCSAAVSRARSGRPFSVFGLMDDIKSYERYTQGHGIYQAFDPFCNLDAKGETARSEMFLGGQVNPKAAESDRVTELLQGYQQLQVLFESKDATAGGGANTDRINDTIRRDLDPLLNDGQYANCIKKVEPGSRFDRLVVLAQEAGGVCRAEVQGDKEDSLIEPILARDWKSCLAQLLTKLKRDALVKRLYYLADAKGLAESADLQVTTNATTYSESDDFFLNITTPQAGAVILLERTVNTGAIHLVAPSDDLVETSIPAGTGATFPGDTEALKILVDGEGRVYNRVFLVYGATLGEDIASDLLSSEGAEDKLVERLQTLVDAMASGAIKWGWREVSYWAR